MELLGFKNLGQFEKVSWSVPVDLDGVAYLIEHRKMGCGVFVQNKDTDEPQAQRIVSLIKKGISKAAPFFRWLAENAISDSKINVRNVSDKLFRRYQFFLDAFREASAEVERYNEDNEIARQQRQLPFEQGAYSVKDQDRLTVAERVEKFTLPHFRMQSKAGWLAFAAIDAFFSWTEHVFIHIAILQGTITTGAQLKRMVVEEWKEKYKHALDISDPEARRFLDTLVPLKNQLRNFVAHGAFGRGGDAAVPASGAMSFREKTEAAAYTKTTPSPATKPPWRLVQPA